MTGRSLLLAVGLTGQEGENTGAESRHDVSSPFVAPFFSEHFKGFFSREKAKPCFLKGCSRSHGRERHKQTQALLSVSVEASGASGGAETPIAVTGGPAVYAERLLAASRPPHVDFQSCPRCFFRKVAAALNIVHHTTDRGVCRRLRGGAIKIVFVLLLLFFIFNFESATM